MIHTFHALIQIDPDKAKRQMVKAFTAAGCHYGDASKALGCNQHTFTRWAKLLGIKTELEALTTQAEEQGWHHGSKGGAAYHHDPKLRAKRASRTRAKNAKG